MNKPLCFVIMPFGKKKDADGNEIDFDEVYHQLINPAIETADLTSLNSVYPNSSDKAKEILYLTNLNAQTSDKPDNQVPPILFT